MRALEAIAQLREAKKNPYKTNLNKSGCEENRAYEKHGSIQVHRAFLAVVFINLGCPLVVHRIAIEGGLVILDEIEIRSAGLFGDEFVRNAGGSPSVIWCGWSMLRTHRVE